MAIIHDKIIIGAGLYGLYSALLCGRKGENVLILEQDSEAFSRATYINQARVHMGYHYPRSLSTAMKSAHYFDRFVHDFGFACLTEFEQIYATSTRMSWTNAREFVKFCHAADIPCEPLMPDKYFRPGLCDGAFLTKEYTYDAHILRAWFLEQISRLPNVEVLYDRRVSSVSQSGSVWRVKAGGISAEAPFLLNASYASVNEIHRMLGFEPFGIKYELCEIILCTVSENLRNIGLTVMDGPFFSIMPFGKTGLHSLTSVTFTPHETSYEDTAVFPCQKDSGGLCGKGRLCNCNTCPAKPESAWPYMRQLAEKYMRPEYEFRYVRSLYSMKPILKASEVDDSRPTVIRQYSSSPAFVSVLSGKINTVYDLDEVLSQ
ncbi:MAG: FAD-binding oxidoreductase [Synergistaceae bacterium]|nr:FAD-binding oxidoreductase [Synergistaceae bacterium]MBQ6972707.1 FAD-binding oxidoreductase [Synergistaceae bacterium]